MEHTSLDELEIQKRNDEFRRLGAYRFTKVVSGLMNEYGLIVTIAFYNDFHEGNDPYREHDFGSLMWEGKKIFWKIDYYDQNLKFWADPTTDACRRVLTVMLAEEY